MFTASGFSFKRFVVSTSVSIALLAGSFALTVAPGWATDLPPAVLNYLKSKDPAVNVRFDGLVSFPNGERYIPVIPQDPGLTQEAQGVVSTVPEKSTYPDLVEFDNHYFLLRLIETSSGRLTFAKLDNYPIQLKEGLLPQDLVLPDNLYIPLELKVILGALPYNPTFKPAAAGTTQTATKTPAKQPAKNPAKTTVPNVIVHATTHAPNLQNPQTPLASGDKIMSQSKVETLYPASTKTSTTKHGFSSSTGYIYDLETQKLLQINTVTGKEESEVPLDSVPSSLLLSRDGKLLFAPCQSNNELVVIDTHANLIKTRLPVGERPTHALLLPKYHQIAVSNMFSPFLSVVDTETLLAEKDKVVLPGNGGVMAVYPEAIQPRPATLPPPKTAAKDNITVPIPPRAAIADATEGKIYILNLDSRLVEKTFNAPPDISAITVLPSADGGWEIWAASRTKNQVVLLDGQTGTTLVTMEVGRKPLAFANDKDTLFVLCAGDAKLSVINRTKRTLGEPLPLEENSFPSAMMSLQDTRRAYITTAGSDRLFVLNMSTKSIESTLPVKFRTNLLALVPPSPPDVKQDLKTDPQTGITVKVTEKVHPQPVPKSIEQSSSPGKTNTDSDAFITPITLPQVGIPFASQSNPQKADPQSENAPHGATAMPTVSKKESATEAQDSGPGSNTVAMPLNTESNKEAKSKESKKSAKKHNDKESNKNKESTPVAKPEQQSEKRHWFQRKPKQQSEETSPGSLAKPLPVKDE